MTRYEENAQDFERYDKEGSKCTRILPHSATFFKCKAIAIEKHEVRVSTGEFSGGSDAESEEKIVELRPVFETERSALHCIRAAANYQHTKLLNVQLINLW